MNIMTSRYCKLTMSVYISIALDKQLTASKSQMEIWYLANVICSIKIYLTIFISKFNETRAYYIRGGLLYIKTREKVQMGKKHLLQVNLIYFNPQDILNILAHKSASGRGDWGF